MLLRSTKQVQITIVRDEGEQHKWTFHVSSPALEKVEALDPSDYSFSQEGDCWLCDFAANSENELTEHIIADHASAECDKKFYMYKLISSSVEPSLIGNS